MFFPLYFLFCSFLTPLDGLYLGAALLGEWVRGRGGRYHPRANDGNDGWLAVYDKLVRLRRLVYEFMNQGADMSIRRSQ